MTTAKRVARPTPTQVLKRALRFSDQAAEGALAIKETLASLDPSTTEGLFELSSYRGQVALVTRMVVLKGLLRSAGLSKWEDRAMGLILESSLGSRPSSPKQPQ